MLGIDDDTGIARRTTGGMDTHSIIEIGAHQTEGIVVAQVLLRGEGDLAEVGEGVDGVGSDTEFAQALLIEG